MQISLRLNTEQGEQIIDASCLTEKQADKLVDAFIGTLGLAAEPDSIFPFESFKEKEREIQDMVVPLKTFAPAELADAIKVEDINIDAPAIIFEDEPTEEIIAKYAPKVFGNSMQEKMAEAFQKQADEAQKKSAPKPTHEEPAEYKSSDVTKKYVDTQNHHETGIKYKLIKGTPNVPTYRCRWNCPNPTCNDRGNHYLPEGTVVTYCYTCNAKLRVEDATSMGFPNRDDNGNFYVANEEY